MRNSTCIVAVHSQDSIRLACVMLSWLCTATILLEIPKQKTMSYIHVYTYIYIHMHIHIYI